MTQTLDQQIVFSSHGYKNIRPMSSEENNEKLLLWVGKVEQAIFETILWTFVQCDRFWKTILTGPLSWGQKQRMQWTNWKSTLDSVPGIQTQGRKECRRIRNHWAVDTKTMQSVNCGTIRTLLLFLQKVTKNNWLQFIIHFQTPKCMLMLSVVDSPTFAFFNWLG